MAFDKVVNMLIFDGDPNHQIMCEISNWNGRIYKISRNELSLFQNRVDCQNTGVYFLFGSDIDNGDTVYIGEAERIYDRLKQHLKDTIYWNECIVVISKDNHLNKAHVKYLEHQFYGIAKEVGRFKIVNATIPVRASVSEYDVAMLEEFIERIQLLTNILGKKVFESIVDGKTARIKDEDFFKIKAARGADAQGLLVSDGFAVLKGSKISVSEVPSIAASLASLRGKLISDGIVNSDLEFTRDYVFTSPSLAASVLMGRNANGKAEWKNNEGKTINDIEKY